MAKTKLSTRILNAYRALRGDPWPVEIEAPKIAYNPRPAVEIEAPKIAYNPRPAIAFAAATSCPIACMDLQGMEVTDENARRTLAERIGLELLDGGAIKITRESDIRAGRFYYRGKVWAVIPAEEDDVDG